MSDDKPSGGEAGISTRTMEIAVALILLAVGVLVVVDSYRLGSKWGSDGPQSGYFPFYIGLLLCISSAATLVEVALTRWRRRRATGGALAERQSQFVAWGQLKLVLSVLIPALVYVIGVQLIGIYVASAIYIATFMRWLGKYPWPKSVAIGVIVSASIFAMFEIWFKVPLFKGAWDPLAFLGY
jgi:putative tricarboxylic transport membrane protein